MTVQRTFFEYFILIKCIKYEVIINFTGITAKKLSPTVHLNDILLENYQKLMKLWVFISTIRKRLQIKQGYSQVITNLEHNLPLSLKSVRQPFLQVLKVKEKCWYLLWRLIFHFDTKRKYFPQLSLNLAKFGSKHEMSGNIFVKLACTWFVLIWQMLAN